MSVESPTKVRAALFAAKRSSVTGGGAVACVVLACACGAGARQSTEPAPHGAAAAPVTAPRTESNSSFGSATMGEAGKERSGVASSSTAHDAPSSDSADAAGSATDELATVAPSVGGTNASLPVADAAQAHGDLPRGTTVLHIGDSFAGALGIELNRELEAAGVRGILKYETATYIPTWAWGKDLERYLSKYHPDLVLITLGANELEIPDPASRAPTIRHLVERLAGRPCVWVAPPLWHGARPALLDVIRASCAPCAYLDSTALVPELPRARDGIHPAMAARKAWATAVIGWLAEHRRMANGQAWHIAE